MELEIKGFIEFCRFLANYPEDIAKNEELVAVLDFCFTSLSTCNCAKDNKKISPEAEQNFFSTFNRISKTTQELLGQIFDKENKYTSISISFPINDIVIKIK